MVFLIKNYSTIFPTLKKQQYLEYIAKICFMILFFLFPYVILTNIENENKQMWFATFNSQLMLWARRWCYGISCFIRNNILTFIWLSCRNYYSICLSYTSYNFKQIDNKKTHLYLWSAPQNWDKKVWILEVHFWCLKRDII